MSAFNRICFFLLLFCGIFFTYKFCHSQTDGFTIAAISSKRANQPEYETRPLTAKEEKELKEALSQKYTYFGHGGQAFVFFSEDNKYVIKFFKQRLFTPSWVLNHLPLSHYLYRYKTKRNWKRNDKLRRDFQSYKISFEELKNETGVVFTHLNKTNHLKTKLKIRDPIKIWHTVNLDDFDFIIQKRADKVYERIDYLMARNRVEEAKKTIEDVFALIYIRAKKGYRDRDPNIETNCGFIEDKPVKIDVGRFVPCSDMKKEEVRKADLLDILPPFEEWIKETHPSLFPYYKETKDKYTQ